MDQTELARQFQEFIDEYYQEELAEAIRLKKKSIEIDFYKLCRFNYLITEQLLNAPEETLKLFSVVIDADNSNTDHSIGVRLSNVPKSEMMPIRKVRSRHLNKFIAVEGNIKTRTRIRPKITESRLECPACGNIITLLQLNNSYRESAPCGCGRKGKLNLISNTKIDFQGLSLEEPFENLEEHSVPESIGILIKDDLTDPEYQVNYIPGKPIRVSGILREVPIMKGGKKTLELDWMVEANYCESLEEDLNKTRFTLEEIKEFENLAKSPDLYNKLVSSVATHIYIHDEVREAVLLFLVKGVRKISSSGKNTREYMNILLMGDPGTGKSQIGNEINLLSWRSKKVVGKGASGPGLTGSAERDEALGVRVLTAGAIPMCNEGHVVVDEIDKMDDEVSAHLLESMEDGRITIRKSQVQGELKARTPVFMIGNPKFGRYDPYQTIFDQLNLPKPLINRFDLIFPIKDVPKKESDNILANIIMDKHLDIEKTTSRPIPLKLLKNYLCYVALNVKPKMTKEAADVMKKYFIELRHQDTGEKTKGNTNSSVRNIGITGRQLDGLVRMAEANAKLHMRNKVTGKDAQKAIELMSYSLQAFGIDPDTGKIDIDRISTGVTASQRSKIGTIKDIIETLEKNVGKLIPIDEIVKVANAKGIEENKAYEIIDKLKRVGDIFEPKPGIIKKL